MASSFRERYPGDTVTRYESNGHESLSDSDESFDLNEQEKPRSRSSQTTTSTKKKRQRPKLARQSGDERSETPFMSRSTRAPPRRPSPEADPFVTTPGRGLPKRASLSESEVKAKKRPVPEAAPPRAVVSNGTGPGAVQPTRCKMCPKLVLGNTGSFKFADSCPCIVCLDCYYKINGLCRHCTEHGDDETHLAPFATTSGISSKTQDDLSIFSNVNMSVVFASTKFDIDTQTVTEQERLVLNFANTMSLCLEDPTMTIPHAYHTHFRKTVLADIQAKLAPKYLSTIGVVTLRALDIPYSVWKAAGYTLTHLVEVGYEQQDFLRWDNENPFSPKLVRELEEQGILLPVIPGAESSGEGE